MSNPEHPNIAGTAGEPGELHAFLQAVMFFTRIPVPKWTKWSPTVLERSSAWFSTIGVIVGIVGAAIGYISLRLFDPLTAAVLSTMSTVLVTGAFHEDGLADTCDAMFGARDKHRVLEIMKDSRIGTFGAAGLGLTLLLKVSVLSSLWADADPLWLPAYFTGIAASVVVLPAVHAMSRLGSTALLRTLSYVRDNDDIGSKSKPMAKHMSRPRFAFASLIAIGASAVVVTWPYLISMVAATAVTALLLSTWFRRRLGGYTGDCLGAAQQVIEVVLLLVLAAAWV